MFGTPRAKKLCISLTPPPLTLFNPATARQHPHSILMMANHKLKPCFAYLHEETVCYIKHPHPPVPSFEH